MRRRNLCTRCPEASSDDSFVSFWISGSGTPLTKPLPRPPKKEAEEADDERESDEGLVRLIGSGADDSVLSADSHVESVVSSNSSAGAKKKPATAGAKPAPSGACFKRLGQLEQQIVQ